MEQVVIWKYIYIKVCLIYEIGKEILLIEITKTKPMYVGIDEVCADWGVSRSKGYAIIKQLSDQRKTRSK